MGKMLLMVCISLLLKSLVVASNRTDEIKFAKEIWDSCESHRECKNLKYSQCVSGKCVCLPNYHHHNYRSCRGGINASCDSNNDCQNNDQLGCISNICQSYETFFTPLNADKVQVYRAEKIGSRCAIDDNCSNLDNTQCRAGKCECVRGYWRDQRICKLYTNATCGNNRDCKETGTKCLQNRCMLPDDFFVESNAFNSSLYAAKQLGDVCRTDQHCRNINNSQCHHEVCECAHGAAIFMTSGYGSHASTTCKQVLNRYCSYDFECQDYYGAKCFLNNCSIPEDFFTSANAHNVSLYAATYVGDVCRTDHHCRDLENTHCFDNKCRCQKDFAQIHGKCYKLSDVNCTHDSTCKKYGHDYWCFLNACHQEGIYFDSADIDQWRAKWVEGYCRIDLNCQNLNHTRCEDNKCECTNGFKYESGECKEEPPVDCTKDSYCSDWDKQCILGLCQSPDRFFESASAQDLELYAADGFYGACRTDHHCRNLNNSRCLDKGCHCLRNWEEISGVCQQTVNVTCSDDSDCRRVGTHCFLNTCLYPYDFFDSSNINKSNVYAAKRIYDFCKSNHHCRDLQNTECYKNRCNCLPDHENVEGSCQKAINVTCSNDVECLIPGSYCFLNSCLYPEDFLAPSNNYNISLYAATRINGFCQTDHHCREIQNSTCFHRRCIFKDH